MKPAADDPGNPNAGPLSEKLRLCHFLARLPADDLTVLAAAAAVERHQNGDVLFRHGDSADRFYAVASGHVALFLGEPGDVASLVGIIGPGGTIGEACVCGDAVYPVSAQLFGAGEVIVIPGPTLCERLCARPAAVTAMLGEMSIRLRGQLRQITDLKMKTAAQRLGAYLVELSGGAEGPAAVRLPYEKKLLANYLGMQPETLSRAQMKLQTVGVKFHKKLNAFVVREMGALREFTQQVPGED
jgi:CRP/FNR family transcriptional activator FtrB